MRAVMEIHNNLLKLGYYFLPADKFKLRGQYGTPVNNIPYVQGIKVNQHTTSTF